MRRFGHGILCCVALALLGMGVMSVGSPLRVGGPFNFNFSLPLGVLGLAGGVLLLEAAPKRWEKPVYLLAMLTVAGAAACNFFSDPPIDDGAWFLLRYGREAADSADRQMPAEPFAHMIAFAVVSWLAVRVFGLRGRPVIAFGIFMLGSVAACTFFEFFVRGVTAAAGAIHLTLTLAGLTLLAIGCVGWMRRLDAARIVFALTVTTILVSTASWELYEWPLLQRE
jgi:hypothetical protein